MGLLALDTKRTFVELFDDDEGFDVKSLGEMSMLLLKVRLTRGFYYSIDSCKSHCKSTIKPQI